MQPYVLSTSCFSPLLVSTRGISAKPRWCRDLKKKKKSSVLKKMNKHHDYLSWSVIMEQENTKQWIQLQTQERFSYKGALINK